MNKTKKADFLLYNTDSTDSNRQIRESNDADNRNNNSNSLRNALLFITVPLLLFFLTFSCTSRGNTLEGDWTLTHFSVAAETKNIALSTICIEKVADKPIKSLKDLQDSKEDKDGGKEKLYNFYGFSGVNTYSGQFNLLDKSTIKMEKNIISTKMSGALEALEAENLFLQLLQAANKIHLYTSEGKRILEIISTEEMSLCRFERFTLKDTEWSLVAMKEDDAVVSIENAESSEEEVTDRSDNLEGGNRYLTLSFNTEGQATAKTGLNTLSFPYIQNEKTHSLLFKMENGVATLTAGDSKSMQKESLYQDALSKTSSYAIQGREMDFYDNAGSLLLMFYRKYKLN